jgi:3-oxoacyl-[acyl-carrier-protein] synthase-1
MIGITSYGSSTSAGQGVEALWKGVSTGQNFLKAFPTESWPVALNFAPKACSWPGERQASAKDRLLFHLMVSWREAKSNVDLTNDRVGVILASTKGLIEDHIWSSQTLTTDLMTPLLNAFCQHAEIDAVRKMVVSNACTSSLSAIWLAKKWLEAGVVDSVVVAAAEEVGPFVLQGFQCLHALTSSIAKPFSKERDGLQLGETAAVMIFSKRASDVVVSGVAVDVEGHAVTRSAPSGDSLKRAIHALDLDEPDLIVAHGTGTQINDEIEDQIFFNEYGARPAITGSKWSIGHTLGASGAVDVILACESIRRQTAFRLGNTEAVDAKFRCSYLIKNSEINVKPSRVLVSSLGFGGIHAVTMIEKGAS